MTSAIRRSTGAMPVFLSQPPNTLALLMAPQPGADTPPPSMTYKLFYVSETRAVNLDGLRVVCKCRNVRVELLQAYSTLFTS
jgi:hypothetical protein